MTPMRVLRAIGQLLLWPVRQLSGWLSNVAGFVRGASWRAFLLPSIVSSIQWLAMQVPYAFGFGPPDKMIYASVGLGLAAYLAGYITAFLTWALIVVFAITATVGLLRFVPVVEQYWPLSKGGFA